MVYNENLIFCLLPFLKHRILSLCLEIVLPFYIMVVRHWLVIYVILMRFFSIALIMNTS